MRALAVILILFLAGCSPTQPPVLQPSPIFPSPPGSTTTIARVWDGDTIESVDHKLIRLLGIDCPEPGTPLAAAATTTTARLVQASPVRLETDVEPYDAFGRLLAYVYVKEPFGWSMANITLAAAGLATSCSIPPNGKHRALIDAALADAIHNKRGLWAP